MRRLALPLLVGLVFALPAVSAAASTTVVKEPWDVRITVCNGDTVHLTGTLLINSSLNYTASGGWSIAVHYQPQGVSGVDEQTGVKFNSTGLTRDIAVFTPAGGTVETYVNRFHIQATKGADSYDVSETFHVTVTPDQTVSVLFDNFSPAC
jgi:hypothetical protein